MLKTLDFGNLVDYNRQNREEGGERMNKRIGEIISEKGLKQAFVAEKAGMSQDALSRVLSAKRTLKAAELLALCKILEVDPRELGG